MTNKSKIYPKPHTKTPEDYNITLDTSSKQMKTNRLLDESSRKCLGKSGLLQAQISQESFEKPKSPGSPFQFSKENR